MWKLFEPRSTAARTSAGALTPAGFDSGKAAVRSATALYTEKEDPQPQVVLALGLRMMN